MSMRNRLPEVVDLVKWVLKFYEQSIYSQPVVTDIAVYDSEEEALRHYYDARLTNTIYYYWGYPERVSDEEAERLLKKFGKKSGRR